MDAGLDPPADWRALLPDCTRTLLLRACLLHGAAAQSAWRELAAATGDVRRYFEEDDSGLKSFLAYTAYALAANRIEADPSFRTYARVAMLREELRCKIYYQVLEGVEDALHAVGVRFGRIRGAALAPWIYPDAGVRHNHAIDVLVDSEDLVVATAALCRTGLQAADSRSQRRLRTTLLHASGLPVIVHARLVDLPGRGTAGNLAESLGGREFNGRLVPTVDITSHCLHILGTACCSTQNGNLRWVTDVFHLLRQTEPVDWVRFWRVARTLGIDGFCAAAFGYLEDQLALPVPDAMRSAWHRRETRVEPGERRLFFAGLHGARGAHGRVLRELSVDPGLATAYLAFAIRMPADYLDFRYGLEARSQRLAWHLVRPLRYLRHRR